MRRLKLVSLVLLGMLVALFAVGIVLAQQATVYWAANCAAQILSPASGSLCFQLGVPPKFLYWNGTAWAHFGEEDTVPTTVALDTPNEVASVATAGKRAVVLFIPPNVTLDGTLVPVVSTAANPGASDWYEGRAFFVDENGIEASTVTFPLEDSSDPVLLGIVSTIPVRHIGVKLTQVNSGSADATVMAVAMEPWRRLLGATFTQLGSVNALEVAIGHVLNARGYTSISAPVTVNDTSEFAVINSYGATRIRFNVPAGVTGTWLLEASDEDPSNWFPVKVKFDTGSYTSFPARGSVDSDDLGHREYRIRFTQLSAGSTAPLLLASTSGHSPRICELPESMPIDTDSDAVAQLVALTSGQTIYVCGWDVIAEGSTKVQFLYGTQTTTPCDTGAAAITGPYSLIANQPMGAQAGQGYLFKTTAGTALCLDNTEAVQISGRLTYDRR